jgi:uncharacterized protein (DUF1810 family)
MSSSSGDPLNLERFIEAQRHTYDTALREIREGRKRTHWMWYVFPQFAGLGMSRASQEYSVKSLHEAEAYLAHPLLGPRLVECAEAVLQVEGRSATDIFGSPDDMKLRSCATLFGIITPSASVFHRLIDKYYQGRPDDQTLRLVRGTASK